MRTVDALMEGNARYVETRWAAEEAELTAKPRKGLAVVACMDARYSVARVLGLDHGDAKIIRNAGNVVDDDALRSLLVAVHLLDVDTVAILGHSDCGMQKVAPGASGADRVVAGVEAAGGALEPREREELTASLGGFDDVAENVRRGVRRVREDPHLPQDLDVVGLIYDNDTGRVSAVPDGDVTPPEANS